MSCALHGHAWSVWSYEEAKFAGGVVSRYLSKRCYLCGVSETSDGEQSDGQRRMGAV